MMSNGPRTSVNAATSSKDKAPRSIFSGKKKPKPKPEPSYDAEMQRDIEAIEAMEAMEALEAKKAEDRVLQMLTDEELAWQMQQEENHLAGEIAQPLRDSEDFDFDFITPSLPPKPIAYTAPYLPVNGIDVSTPPASPAPPTPLTPPAVFKPDAPSSPTSPGLKPDEQDYKPDEESYSPVQSRARVPLVSPAISVLPTPAYISPSSSTHFSTPTTPLVQRQPPAPVQSTPVFTHIQTPVPQPSLIPPPTPVPIPQVPMYPPPQNATYPPPQNAAYPPLGYDPVHPPEVFPPTPATNYTDTARTANYGFSMLYINRNHTNMSVANSASMVDGKVSVVDSVSDDEPPLRSSEGIQMNAQRRTENDDPIPPPRRRIKSMFSEKEQVDLPLLPSSAREGTFVIQHHQSGHSVSEKRPIPPPRRHSSAKVPSSTRPTVHIRTSSNVGHGGDNNRNGNRPTPPPNGDDDEESRPIPPQRHRPKSAYARTLTRQMSDETPVLTITTVTSVPARPSSTPVISQSMVAELPNEEEEEEEEEEMHFSTPLQAKLTIPQRNIQRSSLYQVMPITSIEVEDPFSDKSEVVEFSDKSEMVEEEPPALFKSTSQAPQESSTSWALPSFTSPQTPPLTSTPSWAPSSVTSFQTPPPSFTSPRTPPSSFRSSQTPPLSSTPSWAPSSVTSFQTPPPSFTSPRTPPSSFTSSQTPPSSQALSSSVLSHAPSPRPPKPRRPLPALPISAHTLDHERDLPPIPTPVSSHPIAPPRKNLPTLPQNVQSGTLQTRVSPPSVPGSPSVQYDTYMADEGWSQADAEKYLAEEDHEFGYLYSNPDLEPTSPTTVSSSVKPKKQVPLKVTNPSTGNMRHIIVDSINRGTSLWIKVHPTDTGRQLADRIGVIATFRTRRVTAIYTSDGRSIPLNNTPLFSNWDDVASFTDGEQWRIEYGEPDKTVAGKIKEVMGNSVLSMVPKGWKPVSREPRDERMDHL